MLQVQHCPAADLYHLCPLIGVSKCAVLGLFSGDSKTPAPAKGLGGDLMSSTLE